MIPDAWLRPGQVLGDKYRVERVLGAGGMGIVVAATHLQLGQMVALKFLRKERMEVARDLERFMREARSVAQLRSPHIARIMDAGTVQTGTHAIPFMALEYLEGVDLAQALARRGRLPVGATARIIIEACAALGEAHDRGIVHRDIKPANLFLARTDEDGLTVKVLDFGVAKSPGQPTATTTTDATMIGSPAYMSPEQMRVSRTVDPRSDIWSLGIVMYQAVTGSLPFGAEVFADLCLQILTEPMPALSAELGVPAEIEAIVARCLEKSAGKRFASAAELAAALTPFASSLPPLEDLSGVPSRVATDGSSEERLLAASSPTDLGFVDSAVTVLSIQDSPIATNRRPWRRTWILVGAGLALAAAVGAVEIFGRSNRSAAKELEMPRQTIAPTIVAVPEPTPAPTHLTTVLPLADAAPASRPVVLHSAQQPQAAPVHLKTKPTSRSLPGNEIGPIAPPLSQPAPPPPTASASKEDEDPLAAPY